MTKEEKEAKINHAIEAASGILLRAFVECELKNDVQAMIMDPDTKIIYKLNFSKEGLAKQKIQNHCRKP